MHTSVFAKHEADVFTTYNVKLYLEKITGGIPANPNVLKSWIETKLKGQSRAQDVLLNHLRDMHPGAFASLDSLEGDELDAALSNLAGELGESSHGSIFKRDGPFPIIEGRQIKSMLKEASNVVLGKMKLGGYKTPSGEQAHAKVAKGVIPETVFVPQSQVRLYAEPELIKPAPVAQETRPCQPRTEQDKYHGAPSQNTSLKLMEVAHNAYLTFDMRVLRGVAEALEPYWPHIFIHAQENGLGADRSQGSGRFTVIQFERQS